jgi:hypothetical protein
MAFTSGQDSPSPVSRADIEALLATISSRVSDPDACIFRPASPNRQVNRESTILGGKVDEAPNERTHPTEQSLLDRPAITPVCLNNVTSARLFAAKVAANSLDLLCTPPSQGATIAQ